MNIVGLGNVQPVIKFDHIYARSFWVKVCKVNAI